MCCSGYPEDRHLRKVEKNVLVSQIIRQRARDEKCVEYATAFGDCAKEAGLSMFFKCRKENEVLKECLAKWFNDAAFREECTEQYLAERAEYRKTGVTKKQRLQEQTVTN